MPLVAWNLPLPKAAGYSGIALGLALGTTACATPPAADAAAPLVRTTRGDPVHGRSPTGVEVKLGASRVLPSAGSTGRD